MSIFVSVVVICGKKTYFSLDSYNFEINLATKSMKIYPAWINTCIYIIDYLLVLYILYNFWFQELVDTPEYVSSGASRFDVKQGELGK